MARLIDIDQKVIVTLCDETKGGMLYEIQLTIGELLEKSLSDFKPEVVDAIPVEWLKTKRNESMKNNWELVDAIDEVLKAWRKEQEVR